MALTFRDLAKPRHGFEGVTFEQDTHKLVLLLQHNPDLHNVLAALCKQRDMLEAEVSRLGFKVTTLENSLRHAQNAVIDLQNRIFENR